jgi:hypothetical protein
MFVVREADIFEVFEVFKILEICLYILKLLECISRSCTGSIDIQSMSAFI